MSDPEIKQTHISWTSEAFFHDNEMIVVYAITISEPEPDRVAIKERIEESAKRAVQNHEYKTGKWQKYSKHEYMFFWGSDRRHTTI